MEATCLSLGSNLGDSAAYIRRALELLRDGGAMPEALSRLYLTEPQGVVGQPDFLNLAVTVDTALEPERLLRLCLDTEQSLGRVRTERWGPRTIDIDVLLIGARVVDTPQLVVPHPRMHERRFVLEPLCELVPDQIHPVLGKSVSQLLSVPAVLNQRVKPLGPLPGWGG